MYSLFFYYRESFDNWQSLYFVFIEFDLDNRIKPILNTYNKSDSTLDTSTKSDYNTIYNPTSTKSDL